MPEELNIAGGEKVSEGTMPEIGAGRSKEAGPSDGIEHAPETAAESAKEKYAEMMAQVQPAASAAPMPADEAVAIDAKAVYDETDAEARVTKLMSLAETKGAAHAVRVAERLNDFYVLDRMHDELAEKFYDALKAKGMLKDE